jgi:hypothetical protein
MMRILLAAALFLVLLAVVGHLTGFIVVPGYILDAL